ncbi:hypothetical protein CF386_09175 [Paraphotobacterium marinum]|uniref:Lipoprotein n=1 Tax=Paraphotobacterium marinum TaxID=1755811 RepID=A0A220VGD3_9GAMM|nr:hypothetical protein [Paraphotobacterium marinum]ASK79232.1 hypothetical protein CF386_09175 [Paraphotobacterium marinum]
MKNKNIIVTSLIGIGLSLSLTACGGGGGDNSNPKPQPSYSNLTDDEIAARIDTIGGTNLSLNRVEFAQNNINFDFSASNLSGEVAPPGSFFEPKFKKAFNFNGDLKISKAAMAHSPTAGSYIISSSKLINQKEYVAFYKADNKFTAIEQPENLIKTEGTLLDKNQIKFIFPKILPEGGKDVLNITNGTNTVFNYATNDDKGDRYGSAWLNTDTRLKLNPSKCGDIQTKNPYWSKTSDKEQGGEDTIYKFDPSAPNSPESRTLIVPTGASQNCTIEVYNQKVGNNQSVRLINNGQIMSHPKDN